MASKMYVTKGYSTYTNIPTPQGVYEHDRKHLGNQYVVETKTLERVRAPTPGYTDYVGSPSKVELLKEYVHSPTLSGSPRYAPNNYEDYEPTHGSKFYENSSPPTHGSKFYENSSPPVSPNKHVHGYFSDESNRIHSRPGYVRTGNVSGPNKSWLTAGPPATHHPLTNPTNNINEALGLLEESVYYSPRADPRQRGVLDDLATRAQPKEPHRRYARPAFVAKHNDAIDSHEAVKRYRGSYIP